MIWEERMWQQNCVKRFHYFSIGKTNVSCGERLCTECCTSIEVSEISRLLEGLWKLRGIRKKINKRRSAVR